MLYDEVKKHYTCMHIQRQCFLVSLLLLPQNSFLKKDRGLFTEKNWPIEKDIVNNKLTSLADSQQFNPYNNLCNINDSIFQMWMISNLSSSDKPRKSHTEIDTGLIYTHLTLSAIFSFSIDAQNILVMYPFPSSYALSYQISNFSLG